MRDSRHIMASEPCDPAAGSALAGEHDQNHVQGVGLTKPTYVFFGALFLPDCVLAVKPEAGAKTWATFRSVCVPWLENGIISFGKLEITGGAGPPYGKHSSDDM